MGGVLHPRLPARQLPLEVDPPVDHDRRQPRRDELVAHVVDARVRLRERAAEHERRVSRRTLLAHQIARAVVVQRDGPADVGPWCSRGEPDGSVVISAALACTRKAGARASTDGSGPMREPGLVASRYWPPSGPGRKTIPWVKLGTATFLDMTTDDWPRLRVCTSTSSAWCRWPTGA